MEHSEEGFRLRPHFSHCAQLLETHRKLHWKSGFHQGLETGEIMRCSRCASGWNDWQTPGAAGAGFSIKAEYAVFTTMSVFDRTMFALMVPKLSAGASAAVAASSLSLS